MRLVALIDPMVERCAAVLAKKRAAAWLEPAYRDTLIYKTVAEYAAAATNSPEKTPRYTPSLFTVIAVDRLMKSWFGWKAGCHWLLALRPRFRSARQGPRDPAYQSLSRSWAIYREAYQYRRCREHLQPCQNSQREGSAHFCWVRQLRLPI